MKWIKELIEKLKGENADITNEELAKAIREEAKKKGETLEIKSITDAMEEYVEEAKALEALNAHDKKVNDGKKAADDQAKVDKKVADQVKLALKDINILGEKKFENQKTYKKFDIKTGKLVDVSYGQCEEKHSFNHLLKALFVDKDYSSAQSISKEIDVDNEKKLRGLTSEDAKTPLYSDATTGSYAVPTEVAQEILVLTYQLSRMYQLSNKAAIIFNDKVYPIMIGQDFVWITDESTQLSDKTPTLSNPSVSMSRYGGLAYFSNRLIELRGADLISAYQMQTASLNSEFIDLMLAAGSVTTNSDAFNGIVFDANTGYKAAKNFADATLADLTALRQALSRRASDATSVFFGNRKVRDAYGLHKDDAGNYTFNQFVNTGNFAPFGWEFVENKMIPSTINHAASAGSGANRRTGGTADVVGCVDMSKVYIALGDFRISSSEHFKFDYDQVTFRHLGTMGQKVISSSSTAGQVAVIQQLNN